MWDSIIIALAQYYCMHEYTVWFQSCWVGKGILMYKQQAIYENSSPDTHVAKWESHPQMCINVASAGSRKCGISLVILYSLELCMTCTLVLLPLMMCTATMCDGVYNYYSAA